MKKAPSQIDEVYWSYTFEDLNFLVGLKVQEKMVDALQDFSNLRKAIDEALNGSEAPAQQEPTSYAEAASLVRSLGGVVM